MRYALGGQRGSLRYAAPSHQPGTRSSASTRKAIWVGVFAHERAAAHSARSHRRRALAAVLL